ncbi:hypothetical protein [Rhodococcus sp. HS-D2]|uniref:hypothetical protein n=1 Tax=Rhodococcus TaxID=1827 RepID=UPI000A5AB9F6|nr:hypothetical protein [Rhodococcus sp. HS-D2]
MSLFPNPAQLVPLLERGVEALETIAAELVTARIDRHDAVAAVAHDLATNSRDGK